MLYLIKGSFQKMIRRFAGSWMTPNQATFFGIVCAVCVALCFYAGLTLCHYQWLLLFVPLFLLLRMAMNALDGLLAREYNLGSVAGELWNEGADVIGDMVCYGVLYFIPGMPKLSLIVFLMLIWAVEFFGVLGKSMPGGKRRYENLACGKPDRALWMGLAALMLFFMPASVIYMKYFFWLLSVLLVISCFLRIKKIIKEAQGKAYQSYTWKGR